ncbi:Caseinolytic peptidase B protein [Balamuthia mandrillaris]
MLLQKLFPGRKEEQLLKKKKRARIKKMWGRGAQASTWLRPCYNNNNNGCTTKLLLPFLPIASSSPPPPLFALASKSRAALYHRTNDGLERSDAAVDDVVLATLRRSLEKREVIAIVGAGVSAASSLDPMATWKGLLHKGLEFCNATKGWSAASASSPSPSSAPSPLDAMKRSIEEGRYLQAAEELSSLSPGNKRKFLAETVGKLRVRDATVLRALRSLNVPVMTTNFDGLIEDFTGWETVTWNNVHEYILGPLKNKKGKVFHIHGHWNANHWDAHQSGSVILSASDYEQFNANENYTAVLKHLAMTYSLLFIGFGNGLQDPTFSNLLYWAKSSLPKSPRWHYRLVLDGDAAKALEERNHFGYQQFQVVPYGRSYSDLATFLDKLPHSPYISVAEVKTSNEHKRNKYQLYYNARDNNHEALWNIARQGVMDAFYIFRSRRCVETPLHVAANYGNVACLDPLLRLMKLHELGINEESFDCKWTVLHLAAMQGHGPFVERLLQIPDIDINHRDVMGRTPLHWAVKRNRIAVAKLLLSHPKINIAAKDKDGNTALDLCSPEDNELQAMLRSLETSSQPQTRSNPVPSNEVQQEVPWDSPSKIVREMFNSTRLGDHARLKYMLQQGCRSLIKCSDELGNTLLHIAALYGHDQIVALLLENGALVDAVTNHNQWTPVFIAAKLNHPSCLKLLLQAGANPSRRDWQGKLPIDHCKAEASSLCRSMLEEAAASSPSSSASNMKERTAPGVELRQAVGRLFQLVRCNEAAALEQELEREECRGLINISDNVGYNMLHVAALHGYLDCMKVLVRKHCAIDAMSYQTCWTPLFLAARHNHVACVEFLLQCGADPTIRDFEGKRPSDYASCKGDNEYDLNLRYLLTSCESDG